jgi:hypothetical protein
MRSHALGCRAFHSEWRRTTASHCSRSGRCLLSHAPVSLFPTHCSLLTAHSSLALLGAHHHEPDKGPRNGEHANEEDRRDGDGVHAVREEGLNRVRRIDEGLRGKACGGNAVSEEVRVGGKAHGRRPTPATRPGPHPARCGATHRDDRPHRVVHEDDEGHDEHGQPDGLIGGGLRAGEQQEGGRRS